MSEFRQKGARRIQTIPQEHLVEFNRLFASFGSPKLPRIGSSKYSRDLATVNSVRYGDVIITYFPGLVAYRIGVRRPPGHWWYGEYTFVPFEAIVALYDVAVEIGEIGTSRVFDWKLHVRGHEFTAKMCYLDDPEPLDGLRRCGIGAVKVLTVGDPFVTAVDRMTYFGERV